MNKRVREFVLEDLRIIFGSEIAMLAACVAVRADDPVDELLEAPLALRGPDRAAEILRCHDVGRVHGPEVGELHAVLLEVDRAIAPVRHDDVAAFPGHLVVGMNSLASVNPADSQTLPGALAVLRCRPVRRLGHVVPLRNHRGLPLEPLAALVPDTCHRPSCHNRPVMRCSCLLAAMWKPCPDRLTRLCHPRGSQPRDRARPRPTATSRRAWPEAPRSRPQSRRATRTRGTPTRTSGKRPRRALAAGRVWPGRPRAKGPRRDRVT